MSFITKPNSWVSRDSASTTRLSYSLQVSPAPITVSIPGEHPVLASLEFVVTNPTGGPLKIQYIEFLIQAGPGASLTATTQGIATSVSDNVDWIVDGPPTPVTNGVATYMLQPNTGSSVTLAAGASMVLQISEIQTNSEPGNTTIHIKEMVELTLGFTAFQLTTFAAGFFFNGLAATVESKSALIPVAQVKTGTRVRLVWNSSVVDTSAFIIYYSDATRGQLPATPTDVGEWLSEKLISDTVFTVVATVSIPNGEKLTASMTTSVSVQNPTLVAASITAREATVNGPARITDRLTADSADILGPVTATHITGSGATITGPLSATGITTSGAISAGSVTSKGETVNGHLEAESAKITAGLTAQTATVNDLLQTGSINTGEATITSAFKASGSSSAFQGMVSLTPGSGEWAIYNTFTDGFILAYVGYPNNNDGCVAWAWYSDTKGSMFATTGGNVGYFGWDWYKYQASNPNMMLVPVAMGDSFGIQIIQNTDKGQQTSAPSWFFWIPLGIAPAPQQISKEALDAKGLRLPEVPKMATSRRAPEEDPDAELAMLLAGLFNKLEIDDETKAKLIVALRKQ